MWAWVHHRAARRLTRAAGLAIAVHALALAVFALTRPRAPVEEDEIPIAAIDPESARAIIDQFLPLPPLIDEVVDQKGNGEAPAEPTKFIAEEDANPSRETRRKLASSAAVPRRGNALPMGKTGGPAASEEASADGTLDPGGPAGEAPAAGAGEPAPKVESAARTMAIVPSPTVRVEKDSVDDLDLPLADETAVRARRSAVAAYLNVMKSRVQEYWHPLDAWRSADPKLTRLSDSRLRETVFRVRLRPDGGLAALDLSSSSGIPGLDQAAVSALQQAQPFSPPPRDLLDGGQVFTVEAFAFAMDNSAAAYLTNLSRTLRETWRPSPAFKNFIPGDRVTVVDLRLTFDGLVDSATVFRSSGFDYLDNSALGAVTKGTQLPRPPSDLPVLAGLHPVRILFLHRARRPAEVIIPR